MHAAERHGDPPEPFAGLKPGPDAGQLGDVHAHVEQAPLHRGVRPPVAQGLEQAATPVAHDRQRRDPGHQARPCGAGLAPGQLTSRSRARRLSRSARPPAGAGGCRPDAPRHAPGRPAGPAATAPTSARCDAERACGHGTLPPACPSTAATPAVTEVRGPPVVRARARRPARPVLAPPPGPSRRCGAVLLHSDHGTRDIRERSCHSGNHIRTPRTHTRATRSYATERTRNPAGRETPTRHIRPAGNPNRTRPHGQSRTHKLAYNPPTVRYW